MDKNKVNESIDVVNNYLGSKTEEERAALFNGGDESILQFGLKRFLVGVCDASTLFENFEKYLDGQPVMPSDFYTIQ